MSVFHCRACVNVSIINCKLINRSWMPISWQMEKKIVSMILWRTAGVFPLHCCRLQFVSFSRRDVEEDISINCLMALCVPVCVSVYSSVLHINQRVREVSERIHRDMRRETCWHLRLWLAYSGRRLLLVCRKTNFIVEQHISVITGGHALCGTQLLIHTT